MTRMPTCSIESNLSPTSTILFFLMVLICSLWGYGGILVHELSHAYHNKFCPNGFNCKEILEVCTSPPLRSPLISVLSRLIIALWICGSMTVWQCIARGGMVRPPKRMLAPMPWSSGQSCRRLIILKEMKLLNTINGFRITGFSSFSMIWRHSFCSISYGMGRSSNFCRLES